MQAKKTVAQIVVDAILAHLDSGVSPWHKPWVGGEPRNIAGREYRGINKFLLGCAPYPNPVFLTFKQAHEYGGNIKKGEKALPCVFWRVSDVLCDGEDEKDGGDDADAKNAQKSRFVLRYYNVWNIEQVEGLPDKVREKADVPVFEHDPISEAEAVWDGYKGAPPMFEDSSSAFYSPANDEIHVPPRSAFPDLAEFYSTLFHEAGHSTGHSSRLSRDAHGGFGTASYGREELVAELCAAILCNHCGITRTLKNAAAYCGNWSKTIREAPAKAVVAAASAAQKASDFILGVEKSEAA